MFHLEGGNIEKDESRCADIEKGKELADMPEHGVRKAEKRDAGHFTLPVLQQGRE